MEADRTCKPSRLAHSISGTLTVSGHPTTPERAQATIDNPHGKRPPPPTPPTEPVPGGYVVNWNASHERRPYEPFKLSEPRYGFWQWANDNGDLIVILAFLLFLLAVFGIAVLGGS